MKEENEIDWTTKCGDCGKEFNGVTTLPEHDCTPKCSYCGKTMADLDEPFCEYASVSISAHQVDCDERNKTDEKVNDTEALWRKKQRKRKKQDMFEAKIERKRRMGFR